MPDLGLERRLTEVEQRAKSNSRRLDAVEGRQNGLEELVASVKVLATRQEAVESDVAEIKSDVKALVSLPGKRWDSLITALLGALVGAFAAWLASGGAA